MFKVYFSETELKNFPYFHNYLEREVMNNCINILPTDPLTKIQSQADKLALCFVVDNITN